MSKKYPFLKTITSIRYYNEFRRESSFTIFFSISTIYANFKRIDDKIMKTNTMKKIILLAFFITSTLALFAHTGAETFWGIPQKDIIKIEEGEYMTVVTYLNEDGETIHQIIAAVAIAFLPETLKAVCQYTLEEDEQYFCDVVYNVTSVLVTLTGRRLYKGVTHGFHWSAAKGPTRGVTRIETSTYDHVRLFRRVLKAYHSGCVLGKGIPWESINTSDYNSEAPHYGIGNETCHGLKKNLTTLYECSYQNLMMDGWKNNRPKSFNQSDWYGKKMVQVHFDNILLLEEPGFNKDVFGLAGLTYAGEYFEYMGSKTLGISFWETINRGPLSTGVWYKIRTKQGQICWILASSYINSKYSRTATIVY